MIGQMPGDPVFDQNIDTLVDDCHFNLHIAAALDQRVQKFSQRINQGKQLRCHDVALLQIYDPVTFFGAEAQLELRTDPCRAHCDPSSCGRWRNVNRHDLGRFDLLGRQCMGNAVGDEFGKARFIQML